MEKQCPFLQDAGYISGPAYCRENCALYVKAHNVPNGCALEVIALALSATSNGFPVRYTIREE